MVTEKFKLVVSLPENDVELARSAEAGGADAVKLHLNIIHSASGTCFGNWQEEREKIQKIVEAVKCEIGVMPGTHTLPSEEDFQDIKLIGVKFLDLFAHNATTKLLTMKPEFDAFIAVSEALSKQSLQALIRSFEGTALKPRMLELAIVPKESYGAPLNATDLMKYREIAEASPIPILIPSEKLIEPEDLRLLKFPNVGGIMIGVISTGRSAKTIESVTRKFRMEIDKRILQ